jgi:hypothetical protein
MPPLPEDVAVHRPRNWKTSQAAATSTHKSIQPADTSKTLQNDHSLRACMKASADRIDAPKPYESHRVRHDVAVTPPGAQVDDSTVVTTAPDHTPACDRTKLVVSNGTASDGPPGMRRRMSAPTCPAGTPQTLPAMS